MNHLRLAMGQLCLNLPMYLMTFNLRVWSVYYDARYGVDWEGLCRLCVRSILSRETVCVGGVRVGQWVFSGSLVGFMSFVLCLLPASTHRTPIIDCELTAVIQLSTQCNQPAGFTHGLCVSPAAVVGVCGAAADRSCDF